MTVVGNFEQLRLDSGLAAGRLFDGSGRAPVPVLRRDLVPGVAFHPAVAAWFEHRFPAGPTPPQVEAWPSIAAGRHTLVAAPTGSGKTLAGFLMAINRLYVAHARGLDVAGTRVVYVSPLKALAVDIAENLERPLVEIAEVAATLGLAAPALTVAVRTGDTPASERQAMVRRPRTFVITTPESLYLLVTAARSREGLGTVETVIVDEIHAVARDKRGSHLALTLERLAHVAKVPPARIGLSATQRPIETVARLLVGTRTDARGAIDCAIADTGHQRHLDLAIELPDSELEAVASATQMAQVLDRIAELVAAHRTTLVFVNTRSLAERLAHQLGERLGEEVVAAHHGSLSKDRRHRVERRLRAGELRALVATASLELGIDVGPVELVCQIGSPRSIATFLQRVGRSNHTRAGTPRGRLYPLTARRAGGVHGPAVGGAGGPARRAPSARGPARHPGPADGGRDRGRAVDGGRPVRPGRAGPAPYAGLSRAELRRGGHPGQRGHRDRPGPAGGLGPPRRGQRRAAGPRGAPATWPSPRAAPSPRSTTCGWWPSPTRP